MVLFGIVPKVILEAIANSHLSAFVVPKTERRLPGTSVLAYPAVFRQLLASSFGASFVGEVLTLLSAKCNSIWRQLRRGRPLSGAASSAARRGVSQPTYRRRRLYLPRADDEQRRASNYAASNHQREIYRRR